MFPDRGKPSLSSCLTRFLGHVVTFECQAHKKLRPAQLGPPSGGRIQRKGKVVRFGHKMTRTSSRHSKSVARHVSVIHHADRPSAQLYGGSHAIDGTLSSPRLASAASRLRGHRAVHQVSSREGARTWSDRARPRAGSAGGRPRRLVRSCRRTRTRTETGREATVGCTSPELTTKRSGWSSAPDPRTGHYGVMTDDLPFDAPDFHPRVFVSCSSEPAHDDWVRGLRGDQPDRVVPLAVEGVASVAAGSRPSGRR